MSAEAIPPYWVLISVLFSTHPLEEQLAITLHRVAYELHRTGSDAGAIDQDLAHGVVRNLKKHALLGTVGGPVFEAELETEKGKSQVRFLLTKQGLELMQQQEPSMQGLPN